MSWWARRRLRGKLFLALSAVLVGLLLMALVAVQLAIESQTRETLYAQLRVTGSVFERVLDERRELLVAGSRLLAGDFALKRAIATYDPDTLGSVAVNYRHRIGVDLLWITDETGAVLADSRREAGAVPPTQALGQTYPVSEALETGKPVGTLAEVDRELYHLVCVPVYGPDLIGSLVLGERIDDSTASKLHQSTGSQVAFVQDKRLLAASWPLSDREALEKILPVSPGPAYLAEVDGARYLTLVVPVEAEGPAPVYALLQRSYDAALAPLRVLRRRILLIGGGALIAALTLAVGFARGITAPIDTLVGGMQRILRGDLASRVPATRQDEIGFLARSFNSMSEGLEQREKALQALNAELETRVRDRTAELEASYRDLKAAQAQLVQSEKMASLGVLVAGVAHEINNPVTFIVNNTGPLRELLAEIDRAAEAHPELGIGERLGMVREMVELIDEGAVRTAGIVNDLRSFSRLGAARSEMVDVQEAVDVTLRLLRPRWSGRITIHRDLGSLPPIEAAPGQLNQVLMNLLANACDAIPDQGTIWIAARSDGDFVEISVRDDGTGIAADDLQRIFDPFFTTKPQGKGTGLGLAITHGIVESHGGTIRVESELGRGTEVIVSLPSRKLHTADAGPLRDGHA
jgi:signal transduction histidine kinase